MIVDHPAGNRCGGVYRGVVKKHLPHGKCKIWIPGVYPEEFEDKPDCLPDAEQAVPLMGGGLDGNGVFSYPNIGAVVWCRFSNEDVNYPVFFAQTQGGENAFGQYELVFGPDEQESTKHLITSGKSHFQMYQDGRISSIVFNPDMREAHVDYKDDLQYPDSAVSSRPMWDLVDQNQVKHVNVQHVLDNDAGYNGVISSSTHFYDIKNDNPLCAAYYGPETITNTEEAVEWVEANEKCLLSSSACASNPALKAGVQALTTSVKTISKLAEIGGEFAEKAGKFCVSAVGQLNEIAKFDLSSSVQGLSAGVSGVLNTATSAIKTAASGVGSVTNSIGQAIGSATGAAGSAVGSITGAAGSAVGSITGAAGSAIGKITGGVGDAVGSLTNSLSKSLDVPSLNSASSLSGAAGQVSDAFSSVATTASDMVKNAVDVISKAVQAITGTASSQSDAVQNAAGNAAGQTQQTSLVDSASSALQSTSDDILAQIQKKIQGLVSGAADLVKDAATQVKNMTTSVTSKAGDMFGQAKDAFGNLKNGLSAPSAGSAVDSVTGAVGQAVDKIGSTVSGVGDKINEVAPQIGEFIGQMRESITGVVSDAASEVEKYFEPSQLSDEELEYEEDPEELEEDLEDEAALQEDIEPPTDEEDQITSDPQIRENPDQVRLKPYYYREAIEPQSNSGSDILSSQTDNYDIMRSDGYHGIGTLSSSSVQKSYNRVAPDGTVKSFDGDIQNGLKTSYMTDASGLRRQYDVSSQYEESTYGKTDPVNQTSKSTENKNKSGVSCECFTDMSGGRHERQFLEESLRRSQKSLSASDGSYDNLDLTSEADYGVGFDTSVQGVKILSSRYKFLQNTDEDMIYLSGDMRKGGSKQKTTKSDMFLMNNDGLNVLSSGIRQRAERDGVQLDVNEWSILTTVFQLTNDVTHRQEIGDVSDFYVANEHTFGKAGYEAFGDITENQWPIYIERLSTKYIGKDLSYRNSYQRLNADEFYANNQNRTDCQICVVYQDYTQPTEDYVSGCVSSQNRSARVQARNSGIVGLDVQNKESIASSYVNTNELTSTNLNYRAFTYAGEKYDSTAGFSNIDGYTKSVISDRVDKYQVVPLVPNSGMDFALCNLTSNIQNTRYSQDDLFCGQRGRNNTSSMISNLMLDDVRIISSANSCDWYTSRAYGLNFSQVSSMEADFAHPMLNQLSSLSSYSQGRDYFDAAGVQCGHRFENKEKYIYAQYDTRAPFEIGEDQLCSHNITRMAALSANGSQSRTEKNQYRWYLGGLQTRGVSSIYDDRYLDGSASSGFRRRNLVENEPAQTTLDTETSSNTVKSMDGSVRFDALNRILQRSPGMETENGSSHVIQMSSDGSYANIQDVYSLVGNSAAEITTMIDQTMIDQRSIISGGILLSGAVLNKQIVREYIEVPVDPLDPDAGTEEVPVDVETPIIQRGSSINLGFNQNVAVVAESHDMITTISCTNKMSSTEGCIDMRIMNTLGGTVCYLTMDALGNITMSNSPAALNCVKMDMAGNIYIQSTATVNIQSPAVNIKGATTIDGTCLIKGATTMQGACSIAGATVCNSTVTARDCIGGGKSLATHTHSTSMGPTSTPQ